MILEYKIIYSEFSSFSVIALMIDFVVYMSDQQEQPQPITLSTPRYFKTSS